MTKIYINLSESIQPEKSEPHQLVIDCRRCRTPNWHTNINFDNNLCPYCAETDRIKKYFALLDDREVDDIYKDRTKEEREEIKKERRESRKQEKEVNQMTKLKETLSSLSQQEQSVLLRELGLEIERR